MCLYPKLIKNRKYLPNKKNNYNAPVPKDARVQLVAVGCGECIECRQQKAREWQFRLHSELDEHKYNYFVTLTFSEESLKKISNDIGTRSDNAIATIATRRFLERWRKKYGKSVTHWLITELGHTGTERIHLHGILFTDTELDNDTLQSIWQYGWTYTGDYCNQRTINYVVKYMLKVDQDHKDYKSLILTSAGIGKKFVSEARKSIYKYRPKQSKEFVYLPNGAKVSMPIYYRNKFYTEDEREQLWIDRLDKDTIFVRGIEIKNISTDEGAQQYKEILREQQRQNVELGYGDGSQMWKWRDYNATRQTLNHARAREKRAHTRD